MSQVSVPLDELLAVVSAQVLRELSKTTISRGRVMLERMSVPPHIMEEALKACQPDEPVKAREDLARYYTEELHSRAVLWLCGASHRQLAAVFGKSVASIQNGVSRIVPQAVRYRVGIEKQFGRRQGGVVISHEMVSELQAAYEANKEHLFVLDVVTASQELLKIHKESYEDADTDKA